MKVILGVTTEKFRSPPRTERHDTSPDHPPPPASSVDRSPSCAASLCCSLAVAARLLDLLCPGSHAGRALVYVGDVDARAVMRTSSWRRMQPRLRRAANDGRQGGAAPSRSRWRTPCRVASSAARIPGLKLVSA
jgi:hypothetical protein